MVAQKSPRGRQRYPVTIQFRLSAIIEALRLSQKCFFRKARVRRRFVFRSAPHSSDRFDTLTNQLEVAAIRNAHLFNSASITIPAMAARSLMATRFPLRSATVSDGRVAPPRKRRPVQQSTDDDYIAAFEYGEN